ncbi:two component transcriptional regulator, LytTR family [Chitinophaga sp. YR573]|uniref:LytR/AlgR family response regulator transcription factor n=1 Tax=Chitinophaga sp. YR573 TaxID=1881040 RepID=UPI0008CDFFF9|nr:LytTR family DNA-binding domain-containing protein [Chitinophaga sp. YR573]SEW37764.1 two component transcriptional regulator, LytTR family [Chitinophaga sp. YR573]
MINVLIIEDEVKAAKELKKLLEQLRDDMQVTDILQSVEAAEEWFEVNPHPGLIISDIQLADGLSFEFFNRVSVKAPVIFCTAFDEYAIRAFETNGIDYLLKPVEKDKLAQSLEKFDMMKSIFSGQQLQNLFTQIKAPFKTTLLAHFQDKIIPVRTAEVVFVYAANGLIGVFTVAGRKYYVNSTLDELESSLDPHEFYRANRQFIISRNAIMNIEHSFARKLVVKVQPDAPESIVISKAKASEFLKWMEG